MPATAFDTLRAKQALTEAGISDAQAGAIVVMTRDALTEGVATKADIAGLKTDVSKIENIVAKLDAKVENTAAKLDAKVENTAAKLDAKIENIAAKLDAKLDAKISKLESNMLRLAIGIVLANTALTATLIKLLS